MKIQIPAGASRVRVRFARTVERTIGLALSSIAIAVLLLLYRLGISKEKKEELQVQRRSAVG
jgi:hypothetical protein